MRRRLRARAQASRSGGAADWRALPSLATAEQLGEVIQVSARTIHYWAGAGTIPTALRCGHVVRFHPPAVAAALGIDLPAFRVGEEGGDSNKNFV